MQELSGLLPDSSFNFIQKKFYGYVTFCSVVVSNIRDVSKKIDN